jgi:hypothetical protein
LPRSPPRPQAQEVRRLGPAESPISASVEAPAGSYVLYWQEGAALSAHAAMRVLAEQAAARASVERAVRSVEA